jgi:hypothetical protein
MTRAGAHIRSVDSARGAAREAWAQWRRLDGAGVAAADPNDARQALHNRQLCFAHAVYLEAIRHALDSGVGSRGSAMVVDPAGTPAHAKLGDRWRFAPEDESFRERVLVTRWNGSAVESAWTPRRPLPSSDGWFETSWAAFREGRIYDA